MAAAEAVVVPEKAVKDLWTEVLEAFQAGKLEELTGKRQEGEEIKEGEPVGLEPNFIFLGATQSGKTSLLNSFILKDKAEAPKPTGSLDYKYTRSSSGGNEKDVSHFWELGGGRSLVSQIDIALAPRRVDSTLIVLVLDLSKPYAVLPDLLYWLGVIRTRLKVCLSKLAEQSKDSKLVDRMRQQALMRFNAAHADLQSGNIEELMVVPVLVVASKWDSFMNKDPEELKVMGSTLRAYCHASGVSLCYTSQSDKASIANLRVRLQRHMQGKEAALPTQLDRTKPISILAGADSFDSIGLPSGVAQKKSPADTWAQAFTKTFKRPDNVEEEGGDLPPLKLNAEPIVDQALALKSEDLKRIARKMELARKMLEAESSGAYS